MLERQILSEMLSKVVLDSFKTEWFIVLKLKEDTANVKYEEVIHTVVEGANNVSYNRELSENLRRYSSRGFPKEDFSIDASDKSGVAIYFDEPMGNEEEGFHSNGFFYYIDLFDDTIIYSTNAFAASSSAKGKIETVKPDDRIVLIVFSNKDWEYQKNIWNTLVNGFEKLGYEDYTLKSSEGSLLLDSLEKLNENNEFNKYLSIYNEEFTEEFLKDFESSESICLDNVKHLDFDRLFTSFKHKEEVLVLNLAMCNLKELPSQISNFKNLQTISLYDNQIKEFPDVLFSFKRLTNLNLDNNSLTRLPNNINELKHLRFLSIVENNLVSIPEEIFKLKYIEELYLDNNSITSLPENIDKLEFLHMLTLEGNKLTSLPDSICNLTELTDLYLINNKIEKFPDNIGNLKKLELLQLCGNVIPDKEKERLKRELPNCEIDYFDYED